MSLPPVRPCEDSKLDHVIILRPDSQLKRICLYCNSPRQSNFLRRVGSQIRIIKLQSFLFFGTVVKVEATIRDLLDAANWEANPIRFLILDFSLASGVDFSAAEAFLRIQRLLEVREVVLVLCGCDPETPVGKSLRNIELFRDSPEERVRVFSNLNDALEVRPYTMFVIYKSLMHRVIVSASSIARIVN